MGYRKGWQQVLLGDIASEVTVGHVGPMASEYVLSGIPFLRSQDVEPFRIRTDSLKFISQDFHYRLKKSALSPGDVVIVRTGKPGAAAVIPANIPISNCSDLVIVRPGPNLDSSFLAYYINSVATHHVSAHLVGAVQQHFNVGSARQLTMELPSLPEQRAIAHILGTLDDKIELNRRMNETLEEMARALFKSWFVDFDPVHAKATLKQHAVNQAPREGDSAKAQATDAARSGITPPLRGSRQDKGASPQASRWGDITRLYSPQTLQKAQALQQNQTDAEGLIWHHLRNKQLDGYKFRRQQPIGPYIVDFACLSRKVLIELDGGQHAERTAYDKQRDEFLREQGYRLLRFWNNEVFENCFGVLESIYTALRHHPPLEEGSKDASHSGREFPPPQQPTPSGLAAATPPQRGSDWTVERARAYLDSMDADIAALFPDSFVDSELGPIPAGWEVLPLAECIDVARGLSYKGSKLSANGLPMHNLNSIYEGGGYKQEGLKYYEGDFKSRHTVHPGDVIVANTEQGHDRLLIGYAAIVPKHCGEKSLFSHHIYRIRQRNPASLTPDYICRLLNTRGLHDIVSGYATGTTVNMLPIDALQLPQIVVPYEPVLAAFGAVARVARERQEKIVEEVHTLTDLRDTLLPKLVSGELRVKDIERTSEQH